MLLLAVPGVGAVAGDCGAMMLAFFLEVVGGYVLAMLVVLAIALVLLRR